MKKLLIALGVAAVIGSTATITYGADLGSLRPLDRSTLLTFSAPVALPNLTLPAGTYLFRFVNAGIIGPTVLQVLDKDGKVPYAMLSTIPLVRTSDDKTETEIVFKETKSDAPARIDAWFFDYSDGCGFIYPEEK